MRVWLASHTGVSEIRQHMAPPGTLLGTFLRVRHLSLLSHRLQGGLGDTPRSGSRGGRLHVTSVQAVCAGFSTSVCSAVPATVYLPPATTRPDDTRDCAPEASIPSPVLKSDLSSEPTRCNSASDLWSHRARVSAPSPPAPASPVFRVAAAVLALRRRFLQTWAPGAASASRFCVCYSLLASM